MNMHRFTSTAGCGMRRLALSMLGGLLLVLSLLLSPAAFAAVALPASPALSANSVLDLAGVSVLRLSITYTTKQNKPITCTALGTLIASWPSTPASEQNNWVVTDSSALSLTGGKCAPNSNLTSIQLLANNLYTSTTSSLSLLDTLQCHNGSCQDQQGSTIGPVEALSKTPVGGGILFSFHTDTLDMQPFLDTDQANSLTGIGIELATQEQSPTWPQAQASQLPQETFAQAQTFLTPVNASSGSLSSSSTPTPAGSPPAPGAAAPTKFEPGMPFVDAQGRFIGMQVFGSTTAFTVGDLQQLEGEEPAFQPATIQRAPHGADLLKQQWDAGVTEFDLGTPAGYRQAQQDWSVILDASKVNNPNFQAAQTFTKLAAANLAPPGPSATATAGANGSHGNGILGGINTVLLIIGLAAAIIFLILLLVLVSIFVGRRRGQRRKDKQELDRFKEEAATARRQAPLEAQRIAEESQRRQAQAMEAGSPQPYPPRPQSAPLPPVASQAPMAPLPAPQPPQPPQQPADYAAYAAADAPTLDMFDAPTEPANRKNGRAEAGKDGHVVRELHNVSLAVGSLSNVGLKRQHKPNEDSLLAVEGTRTHQSQPQQFGLFVIADGMGGHANGGDASRTAIQTMIDFMLPKISIADPNMDDQGYLKLLEEGVQHANLAVHQRNLQDHADMGTTMTTALVIGSMAYVANVGDSRTYLYRPSTGLTKVTRDHSVVASLVDAGIIKPDDIYTHPKRNQIYRSLGEKPVVEVDTFSVELQAGDKLLLCSDGLWDMVRDPAIQNIISSADMSPTQTSEELIQAALEGGGEDNVSVIVVSVTEVDGHTGMTGIQILSKPESVTVPDLPAM